MKHPLKVLTLTTLLMSDAYGSWDLGFSIFDEDISSEEYQGSEPMLISKQTEIEHRDEMHLPRTGMASRIGNMDGAKFLGELSRDLVFSFAPFLTYKDIQVLSCLSRAHCVLMEPLWEEMLRMRSLCINFDYKYLTEEQKTWVVRKEMPVPVHFSSPLVIHKFPLTGIISTKVLDPMDCLDQVLVRIARYKIHDRFYFTPASMQHLVRVNSFFLGNRNESTLPKCLGQFTNITRLEIVMCHMQQLPKVVYRLTKLKLLNMSFNCLINIPDDIASLANLEVLSMEYNPIVSISAFIETLGNLRKLVLSKKMVPLLPESMRDHQMLDVRMDLY